MSRFCTEHVKERSIPELVERRDHLLSLDQRGPGQNKELDRIREELRSRWGSFKK